MTFLVRIDDDSDGVNADRIKKLIIHEFSLWHENVKVSEVDTLTTIAYGGEGTDEQ